MVKGLICVLLIDFPLPPINRLTQITEKLVLTRWVRNVVIYHLLIWHRCVYTYSLARDWRSWMFPLLSQLVLCPSIRKGPLVTYHPLQQADLHPLYDLPFQHRLPTFQSCFARAPARIKLVSWTPLQKQTPSGVSLPNQKHHCKCFLEALLSYDLSFAEVLKLLPDLQSKTGFREKYFQFVCSLRSEDSGLAQTPCTFYQPQFLYIASTPVKLIDYSWLMSVISTRQWDHLASVETVLEEAAVLSLPEVCPQVCLFSCILCGQGGGAGVFHCWAISSSLLNEFSFKWSTGFSFVVLLFLLLLLWFTVHIGVFKNCSSNFTELVLWFVFLHSEHFLISGCWAWAGNPSKKNYSIYSTGAALEPCDFSQTHFKSSSGQELRGCRDPSRQGLW